MQERYLESIFVLSRSRKGGLRRDKPKGNGKRLCDPVGYAFGEVKE